MSIITGYVQEGITETVNNASTAVVAYLENKASKMAESIISGIQDSASSLCEHAICALLPTQHLSTRQTKVLTSIIQKMIPIAFKISLFVGLVNNPVGLAIKAVIMGQTVLSCTWACVVLGSILNVIENFLFTPDKATKASDLASDSTEKASSLDEDSKTAPRSKALETARQVSFRIPASKESFWNRREVFNQLRGVQPMEDPKTLASLCKMMNGRLEKTPKVRNPLETTEVSLNDRSLSASALTLNNRGLDNLGKCPTTFLEFCETMK